ncbi:hypothetical protein BaRGS_00011820 [Batillaria attramentaria]|uniref:Anoctamin n=1 Tax=Batillaria attramentaria TaxID=370345 RepID=A0ABD0LC35_9CAEN
MFGKKLISKRLLVSSKVWMNTIPTSDCDVVLTIPATTHDTTIMWLLSRLRSRTPRLLVNFKHHSNSGIYALYLTATYESLLEGAEEIAIRKPLRREYGGGMKEFVVEDQECFEGVGDEETFLTSQERQSIVHHMLNELRATEGEELEKAKFVEGQPIVPRLLSKNIVSGVFPLHCNQDLAVLRKTWVKTIFSKQPLDSVCKYFGAKIGLYFAFIGHYTTWLLAPALLGIIMWFVQSINQFCEDVSWVVFSVFNVFWATLYLIHWKRTSATFAYRWGTLDKKDDLLKDPRPLYKGDLRKSPITGRMEPHYSNWKRNLFRYFVSTPVIILFLGMVFTTMLLIFELQEWVNVLVDKEDIHPYMRFGPKVLLAIGISIFDELYKRVALWLNRKENYRLEETHETNLVIKLVLFQFVNSFLSLFYIAFYLRDMDKLREQLAALLITRQVLGNLKEVLLPLIIWKARLYTVGYKIASELSYNSLEKESERVTKAYQRKFNQTLHTSDTILNRRHVGKSDDDQEDGGELHIRKDRPSSSCSFKDEDALTQVEVESAMSEYDDAFEDYLEMCLQFGYVTLFSAAFPLAALFAFLNNVIEIRSDAFKLCYTYQRPFGVRAEDSGIWQGVLHVMALIAVVVNSALIGMGDLVHRLAPTLSTTSDILLIVIFEHVILCIKCGVEYAVPEVPDWIATEMAKVEFQRREALKRLESQGSSSHGSENRDRSPRTKTPDILDTTTAPSLSSPSNHQSLVGHRPQNFSTNHNTGRTRSGEILSSSPPAGEWEQMKRMSPPDRSVDGDSGMYRNPWQHEAQIYRRNVANTSIGRSIVKRAQVGRSKSLEYVPASPTPSPSTYSVLSSSPPRDTGSPSGERISPPRGTISPPRETISPSRDAVSSVREKISPCRETVSPPRETVSPARETAFLASGETVTYVKGSSGKISDSVGGGTYVSSDLGSASSSPVLGSSVDIPREGDKTVDP